MNLWESDPTHSLPGEEAALRTISNTPPVQIHISPTQGRKLQPPTPKTPLKKPIPKRSVVEEILEEEKKPTFITKNLTKWYLILLGVGLLVFIAMALLSMRDPATGVLRGRVSFEETPLPHATVLVLEGNKEERTDKGGTFEYTHLKSGLYTLVVVAEGYLPYQQSIHLEKEDRLFVTVRLEKEKQP